MDKLEQLAHKAKYDSMDAWVFANRAWEAWLAVTGLEPSYVEVLHLESLNATHPRVVAEVDGVRICAFRSHSEVRGSFQQWNIAERKFGIGFRTLFSPDLTLAGLEPYLTRRRKRLCKRGLYDG